MATGASKTDSQAAGAADAAPAKAHGVSGLREHEDHRAMMRAHHERMLWTTLTNIVLGFWLIAGVFAVDYHSVPLRWSDAISGLLIVAFGLVALSPRLDLARWGICFAGIWLLFAPLVFWAPTPFAYANDTLVGALAIALSVLVPMMPGMGHHMAMMAPGPDVPPGWSYNPSSWPQRAPMIAMAFAAFLLSRYLAAFQLGHIDHAWDPFFGNG
ncbi:MAG: SPW repeat domain-containing protein, partial [Chloroflexota bacterium]